MALSTNYYWRAREWPYKNVCPKLMVEQLISETDRDIRDYKFFCFNGVPKFLKVDYDRFTSHKANFYNLKWEKLPFSEKGIPSDPHHIEKRPLNFESMVEYARTLSKGIPFVRVDFYNISGKIYFGELTFYPGDGSMEFVPDEWNLKIGNLIDLSISQFCRT